MLNSIQSKNNPECSGVKSRCKIAWKNSHNKVICSLLFVLPTANCLLPIAFSQDIHFSQYIFSSFTLNPATTAAYKDIQGTLQHKEQWRTVDAYRTSAATFEMKFNLSNPNWEKLKKFTEIFKKKLVKGLAAGTNFFSDKAGDGNMKQTQLNLSLAYHALLNKNNTLSGGIMGGIVQRSIDPTNLRWNSQYTGGGYDPNLVSGENFSHLSSVYGDFSAGLLWSYGDGTKYLTANDQKHIHAGVALSHINTPVQSFQNITSDQLKWKWTAHAGSLIGIKNSNYSVGPSVLYMRQGALSELTVGGLIKYKLKESSVYTGFIKSSALSVGCYYRNKDAVIPFLMYEMDKYSIGISYDTNVSGLKAATSGRGGMEISLRVNMPSPFLYQNAKSRF